VPHELISTRVALKGLKILPCGAEINYTKFILFNFQLYIKTIGLLTT